MKEQLKRRLVGAVVLVSLAIIFIPMLLDSRRGEEQLVSGIPPRDARPYDEQLSSALPEPIKPIDRQPPAAVEESPAEPSAPPQAEEQAAEESAQRVPLAPAATDAPLTGWVIQVGSFSRQEGADSIAAKLRAAGFDTHIEQAQVKGQTVYRVQVGPEADRARAEALLKRIRGELKLEGKVMSYPAG